MSRFSKLQGENHQIIEQAKLHDQEKRLNLLFDRIDTDGSGKLTQIELINFFV